MAQPKTSKKASGGNLLKRGNRANVYAIVAIIALLSGVGIYLKVFSHAASAYCVGGVFASGSSGQCVKDIQTMVNLSTDVNPKITVNGKFNAATVNAVKQLQTQVNTLKPQGLPYPLTVNGRVNAKTWTVLCADSNNYFAGSAPYIAFHDAGCQTLTLP